MPTSDKGDSHEEDQGQDELLAGQGCIWRWGSLGANARSGQGGLGKGSVSQANSSEIGGKPLKEGLLEKLQRHMVAAAYAEAGELESAQEVMSTARSLKTVLLVVEGSVPDPATFTYAVNLCKRTNSQLDILQVIEKSDAEGDYSDLSQSLAEGSHHIIGLVRKLEEPKVPFKVTVRVWRCQ